MERNASLEEEVVEKDEREDEAEAGELRTNCDDGMFAGRPYLSRTMPGSWSLARKKQASASSASQWLSALSSCSAFAPTVGRLFPAATTYIAAVAVSRRKEKEETVRMCKI